MFGCDLDFMLYFQYLISLISMHALFFTPLVVQTLVIDVWNELKQGTRITKDFGYCYMGSFLVTLLPSLLSSWAFAIKDACETQFPGQTGTLLSVIMVTIVCTLAYVLLKFAAVRFLPRSAVPAYMFYVLLMGKELRRLNNALPRSHSSQATFSQS
jgi:hypothetical protein